MGHVRFGFAAGCAAVAMPRRSVPFSLLGLYLQASVNSVERSSISLFGVVERLGLGSLKPWHSRFATPILCENPNSCVGPEPVSASLGAQGTLRKEKSRSCRQYLHQPTTASMSRKKRSI